MKYLVTAALVIGIALIASADIIGEHVAKALVANHDAWAWEDDE